MMNIDLFVGFPELKQLGIVADFENNNIWTDVQPNQQHVRRFDEPWSGWREYLDGVQH